MAEQAKDPPYYLHPCGVWCIEISAHMTSCLGQAFQYGWRNTAKGEALSNLRKMEFMLDREIDEGTVHLVSDPVFREHFARLMSTRRQIFNRPSPWTEPVRKALAALCDYHVAADPFERARLLIMALRCTRTAIEDESRLSNESMPA